MKRLRLHWLWLLFLLLLTLLLTYPLIVHLSTHVPGSDLWAHDEYSFVWNLWWFKYALLNLNQSPLSTAFIFYPVGVNLALYTYTLFNAALALPLLPYLPLPLVSNLLTIFSFVMSGYGAYLLARSEIAASVAEADHRFDPLMLDFVALVAAVAYAFTTSKFVYASIGHYDMVGTEWIPFCALYGLRALRSGKARDALLAGLFLALALYVEMIFGVLLAFLMLILVWFGRERRRIVWSRLATTLILMGAGGAILYLPVLVPVLQELLFADYSLKGWGDAQKLSVDLLGFFSPSALSPWSGLDWNRELTSVAQGSGRFSDVNTVFVGYVTFVVAAVGALAFRRRARAWVAGAFAFALLALGPLLQIGGLSTFDLEGLKVDVPLPFIALHYIPIVQANRVPNRFSAVLLLCVAMLVGYGTLFIVSKLSALNARLPVVAIGLVCTLLVLEHLSVPLPLSDASVPSFYAQLAADTEDYTILQLPLGWRNSFGTLGAEDTRVQYYQSVHHKRILGGNTSRNHPFKFDYFASLPIVSSLLALEDYKSVPPEVRAFDQSYADEFVRFFNLRYVVVHPAVPGRHPYDDTRRAALQYLLDVLPLDPLPSSEELSVYRVRRTPLPADLAIDFGEPAARAYHGIGWDREEQISGTRANWATGTQAQVFIPVESVSDIRLTFSALPFTFAGAPPQAVSVAVNDRLRLAPLALSAGWNAYQLDVPASALQRGINVLTFDFAYARSPHEVLGTADTRALSVAVDWMRWTSE
ncbi:MAG: hypothetical protein E6J26_01420 [Chloroflexi bacterium]|nr:MAG: hypothetical protein E6J26_01420 [Chloroflexota bacterium]